MKRPFFLAGAIIWAVIALVAISVLASALFGLGPNYLPNWTRPGAFADSFGSNAALVKEESFRLTGIDEIEIVAQYQRINISIVSGGDMHVRHYDIDSAAPFDAETGAGRLSVGIPQRFGSVRVNTEHPRLEISLPREYAGAVSLRSSSGSINVDGRVVWGDTRIGANSGPVRLPAGLTCGALTIETSSGSINLGDVEADSVSLSSSSGSQRLEKLEAGGEVSLRSSSGSINAGDIVAPGGVTVGSNSGSLRLGNVDAGGGVADISSSSGSHNAGRVTAREFRVRSSSGSLRYDALSGRGGIESTSGSVNIDSLDARGDVSVRSSSGTQRINLALGQNVNVTISTSSGTIRASGLSLSYSADGRRASGTIGSGGSSLELRSTSGSINVG